MGMERFGDLNDPTTASWCAPVSNALYPDPREWREAASAPGCPTFGRDAIWQKDPTAPVPTTVQPGIHRIGPDDTGHDVVWWDPDVLQLGLRPTPGMRHEELLSKQVSEEIVDADQRRFTDWKARHQKTLEDGSKPSRRVMTTTAYVRPDPGAEEPTAHPDPSLDVDAARVEVIELPVEDDRPSGARFGALVHAALATVPLDAGRDEVDEHVALAARILGAPDGEREPAREAIVRLLAHSLLRRAAKAESAGTCRRESPVALRDAEGVVVDGVIDLAFPEADGWVVVDFKTDRELERDLDAYRRQVALYARAVAAATGRAARGVLVRG
jgi:ATP-dependent exoDNAse (exonuclease V) beta subunit